MQTEEGSQTFEFLDLFQVLHTELEIEFDSIHTIEFTKLLRKFDNQAITPEVLEQNLPK